MDRSRCKTIHVHELTYVLSLESVWIAHKPYDEDAVLLDDDHDDATNDVIV